MLLLSTQTFYREAIIWGQLFHPNVLPFYGIHSLGDFRKSLCLVSPWISNGNLLDFLSERPHIDRIPLVQNTFLLLFHSMMTQCVVDP